MKNAFIDYLQLLSIFFFRKEMESENHSHESIRQVLDNDEIEEAKILVNHFKKNVTLLHFFKQL